MPAWQALPFTDRADGETVLSYLLLPSCKRRGVLRALPSPVIEQRADQVVPGRDQQRCKEHETQNFAESQLGQAKHNERSYQRGWEGGPIQNLGPRARMFYDVVPSAIPFKTVSRSVNTG